MITIIDALKRLRRIEIEHDLARHETMVLCLLHDGDLTPGDLQKKVGALHAQISRALNTLEGRHLVKRFISESDRRKLNVRLTKTGRAAANQIMLDFCAGQ